MAMDTFDLMILRKRGWCWPWQCGQIVESLDASMSREENMAKLIGELLKSNSDLRNKTAKIQGIPNDENKKEIQG